MRQSTQPLISFDAASGPICLGHIVSGIHLGPTMVVLVSTNTGSALTSALLSVPRIANVRGNIIVAYREQLDLLGTEGRSVIEDLVGPVDEWTSVEDVSYEDARLVEQILRRMTWAVLTRAADLGMISGRGIIPQVAPHSAANNSDFAPSPSASLH